MAAAALLVLVYAILFGLLQAQEIALLLGALLLITIAYCMRLDGKLKQLRTGNVAAVMVTGTLSPFAFEMRVLGCGR